MGSRASYNKAALLNSYPNACVPSRQAVCTILIMVFGVTRMGYETANYRMSGGHPDLKNI